MSRAIESPRQLQEVLVNFWFNHFNIGRGKAWLALLFGNYEEQAVRPYILGRFRDMLAATARHPAMLLYLDSDKNRFDYRKTRFDAVAADLMAADIAPAGINENYARELMELHTLGVNGGYTQSDVIALARILSGWRVRRGDQNGAGGRGDFMFDAGAHDPGDKLFLGYRIASAGEAEGEQALDILARHPSTAKHIAFKLSQYFITDEPEAAAVDRLAQHFLQTDGDLRAVMEALVESPEFWARSNIGQKFKTPYEYVVSSLRAIGQKGADYRPAHQALSQMGMPIYGCVTPEGYKNTEIAWLSAEALAQRLSFAASLSRNVDEMSGLRDLEHNLRGVIGGDTLRAVAGENPATAAALLLSSPEFMRR